MEYYHDLITRESFDFLKQLKQKAGFVLIGGWAVFLYTHALKSKDIDIVVDYENLAKLKSIYPVSKNERLKKYEIKTGRFDVDVYLPHYSDLGLEIAEIAGETVTRESFAVPRLETLLLLKLHAWQARLGSAKGGKDELDILSLATLPEFDWKKFKSLVKIHSLETGQKALAELIKGTRRVPELGLNDQKMARLRKIILGKINS